MHSFWSTNFRFGLANLHLERKKDLPSFARPICTERAHASYLHERIKKSEITKRQDADWSIDLTDV